MIGAVRVRLARTGSTNTVALDRARRGAAEGLVVTAEEQTRGRGRRGRTWHSPRGAGLWFSVLLRPERPVVVAQALTFLGAVAVARAVRARLKLPVALKWPNDLLLEGRKVGGVLTECSIEGGTIRHAVIGVGINVNLPRAAFPEDLRSVATSLSAEAGRRVARVGLLARILAEMDARYSVLLRRGPAPLVAEARALMPMAGRIVRVQAHDRVLEGTVRGLDDDGALLLRLPSGTVHRLLVGDVSLLSGPGGG